MNNLPSGTVTFLFTDIEGSTRLLQELGPAYAELLSLHHAVLRACIQEWHGVEVDTQGDAFFVVFQRASDALQATAAMQRSLATQVWPQGASVRVRMGLHTGEPSLSSIGYVGLDVHRAARLCSAGHGGQVLLSEATRLLVESSLPEGMSLRSLGEHRLKDLQRPEQITQLILDGSPAEFPPLKSMSVLPNNLPVQLTSFIGRQDEIRAVRQLLRKERLVTLVGAGGSGKTRLALQAAADLLEDFRDGVWFVDLAALSDPAFVPQTVADVLNLKEQSGRTIQNVLTEYLLAHQVLLILDNCEHLVEACARLAESLLRHCPQVSILATSREALGLAGEHLLKVPALSLPEREALQGKPVENLALLQGSEAVQLFEQRAAAVQPDFRLTESNALKVAQICQRLDGIPLAIELAAARARMLDLEQILKRLDDRFRLLTGGSRTALPRQQTLQALVEWSYDLLSEPEKVLFRRLSIFLGGASMEAAEQICPGEGIARSDILDQLARLVDKSLLLADLAETSTRYRMLEIIRQYAGEKLLQSGEEATLRGRHLDFFFALVKTNQRELQGPEISAAMQRLDTEKDNLYAALEWAIQTAGDNAKTAQEMSAGLWMYWLGRGRLSEGRQRLKKALECSQEPTSGRALALASLGIMIWNQGEITEARQYLDDSLTILRGVEPADLQGLAHATHIRGHLYLDLGDYAASNQDFQESLKRYQQLGDLYWEATLISDLGMVAYHRGDYRSARDYQEQSLVIHQKYGNIEVIAQTLHRIGELARLEGDYARAEECYETCLQTYQKIGMKLEIASNLHKLGFIAQYHGDPRKAHARFQESLAIQCEVGNKQGIAECLAGLAGLAAIQKQPERALRLFATSQALLDSIHAPLAPADRVEWQRDHALACSQVDGAARLQAEEVGKKMEIEQAVAFAQEKIGNPKYAE
jgi:predicted ATPase/class 3 adenylate cyclase